MTFKKALGLSALIVVVVVGLLYVLRHPTPEIPFWTGSEGSPTFSIVSRGFAYAKGEDLVLKPLSERDPRTTLAVLEFDEDGRFAHAPQLGAITAALQRNPAGLVFIYAPGWQASADPMRQWLDGVPGDMAHFDTLLSAAAGLEKGARVFGVYLGWRGESDLGGVTKTLTRADRREVARTIGRGEDLRKAMADIVKTARAANPEVAIVAVGRSLGAGMLEDYADRALWNSPQERLLDFSERPDLIVLLDNAEVQKHSQPIMERVNRHVAVRAALQEDRLVTPWIVSITSEGGMQDRLGRWFAGWFFDPTPGFSEEMLTHDRRNSDMMILPPMAKKEEILDHALRATLEPVFLAPPRKPWFQVARDRAMQYRLVDRGARSAHPGYWNFRLPAAVQEDAGNLYGVNVLGPVLSLLPLAETRHRPPQQELRTLPEWFRADANPEQRRKMQAELQKYCPPSQLDQMLAVQKQTLAIRGEWDRPKGSTDDANTQAAPTFPEIFTNFDRELLYGSLARLPHNPSTIRELLMALQTLPNEPGPDGKPGPLSPAVSQEDRLRGTWPGDWRRRYAHRIFNILQSSSEEASAWTPQNIAFLLALLRDEQMQSCLDGSLDGSDKNRFRHNIGTWRDQAAGSRVEHLAD